MAVTPTGMLSLPLSHLETALAGLSAFQTWTGEATAELAAVHVYWFEYDDPAQGAGDEAAWKAARAAERPVCVIGFSENLEAEEPAPGSYWDHSGDLVLLFEEVAQNDDGVATAINTVTTKEALIHLNNHIGAIMEALESAVSAGGEIDLLGWELRDPPGRMSAEDVAAGQLDIVAMAFVLKRRDM